MFRTFIDSAKITQLRDGENILSRIWSFLKSKLLAIYLICTITGFSLLGMVIPQIALDEGAYRLWAKKYTWLAPIVETLQLNKVFYSWIFLILGSVFFVNLLACTLSQAKAAKKIWRQWRYNPSAGKHFDFEYCLELSSGIETIDIIQKVIRIFKAKGYHEVKASLKPGKNGSASLPIEAGLFRKNSWGVWGSTIFHVGLIMVLLGGLLSQGFKMTGYMMLGEGEIRSESHEMYGVINESALFREKWHSGFDIGLMRLDKEISPDGWVNKRRARIFIAEQGQKVLEATVERGQPLDYKGMRIYFYDWGFAPLVTVTDFSGKPSFQSYVLFNTHRYPTWDRFYSENTALGNSGLVMNAEFYPDYVNEQGQEKTRSELIKNPRFKLSIKQENKEIYNGPVTPGQTIQVGEFNITWGEIRFWTGFEMVRDPGANLVFAGSWLALSGLVILYLLVPKELQIVLGRDDANHRLLICGRSLRGKLIFKEEMDRLVSKITSINNL